MQTYTNTYNLSSQITETDVLSNITNDSVYTPLILKVVDQISFTQFSSGQPIGSGQETRIYQVTLFHENTSWKVVGYKDVTVGGW